MERKSILTLIAVISVKTAYGILGGQEVVPHSRPYQAGIFIGNRVCGGTLISTQTVLTAASCFLNYLGPAEVVLGAHDILINESGQVRVNSSRIIPHKQWTRSPLFDIAVIILPKPVELNTIIQTISLPEDNSTDYVGIRGSVSGWGWVTDYIHEYSPVLMEVKLPIIDNFACEVPYLGEVNDDVLCLSGENGRATCTGDSGSPLVVDNVQVGIVSIKNPLLCQDGYPSAAVKVANFLDWINSNAVL